VPAAAVIPAPIAYIKVVAVKKLVVELLAVPGASAPGRARGAAIRLRTDLGLHCARFGEQALYCEKIRVFQAGNRPDTLAWNNGTRTPVRARWSAAAGVMIKRDSWGH